MGGLDGQEGSSAFTLRNGTGLDDFGQTSEEVTKLVCEPSG